MDIKDKELELLEESLESVRKDRKKYDTTSMTLFFTSIALFVTSDLDSSVKLALFGIEVKSIYAVFTLYLMSLVAVNNYLMKSIRETLLFNRYRCLLKEQYSEIPYSLELMTCTDSKLMDRVFRGRWQKLNTFFKTVVVLPFIVCYLMMAYELISIGSHSKLTAIITIFILIYGCYFMALMCKAIYIKWLSDKAYSKESGVVESDG
ncbi:hypothetical protein QRC94_004651 [Vibrio vulnificus]|nr:hypothetical protein [Vibrio vulnificus]EJC6822161.1 hypothetical protein [Vibrio vulnificus]EJC6955857.1 hypothetical protein [Vibrio vulnificus]EJC6960376.1 hypothetical protein [Vibrio vulnificus]EKQ3696707.1 hypothetical protein [Vibrio vulnificus]